MEHHEKHDIAYIQIWIEPESCSEKLEREAVPFESPDSTAWKHAEKLDLEALTFWIRRQISKNLSLSKYTISLSSTFFVPHAFTRAFNKEDTNKKVNKSNNEKSKFFVMHGFV